MILGALLSLQLISRIPSRLGNKTCKLVRSILVIGIKFSGFVCFLGLSLGCGFASWLLRKLVAQLCRRSDGGPCPRALRRRSPSSSSSDAASQEHWEEAEDMGNEASHDGDDGVMVYSDLRRRDNSTTERRSSIFGAVLREHSSGASLSGEITSCCTGGIESKRRPPTERASISDSESHTSEETISDLAAPVCTNVVTRLDSMKDSGFMDATGGQMTHVRNTDSSIDMETDTDTDCDNKAISSGHHSLCDSTDLGTIVDFKHSSPGPRETLHSPETIDPQGTYKGDVNGCPHPLNYAFKAMQESGVGSLERLQIDMAREPRDTSRMEGTGEGDDAHRPCYASPPHSADLRRRLYRERSGDVSLPSPVLSQRGYRSRSSSTVSSDASFDPELSSEDHTSEFLLIETELTEIARELTDFTADLTRLQNFDTGEWYVTPRIAQKLSHLVAASDDTKISRCQLNKAYDLLRRHSSFPCAYPRMSSMPPIPAYQRVSADAQNIGSRMVVSKSLHSLPRCVLHEDVYSNMRILSDDEDELSLDSRSTFDTSLGSTKQGSMDSLTTLSSADRLLQSGDGEYSTEDGRVEVVDILKYVGREWRGDTHTAETIRQGYHCVVNEYKCKRIVRIRGDNYCALRAAYCSIVLNCRECEAGLDGSMQRLAELQRTEPSLLHSWLLPDSMPDSMTDDENYEILCRCLEFYNQKTRSLLLLTSRKERRKQLFELLNTGSVEELFILESIKLLMFLTAYDLYKANLAGEDVPVFVWLLFARDTSETPGKLIANHLNRVGRTAGLEQVEMCLLGHCLGVSLQAFRLYQHGEMDFVAYYPEEDNPKHQVPIVAEDDRHYNTALQEQF